MRSNSDETASILRPLAELVAETDVSKIPGQVIREAELSVLDTLGCIIRGTCMEEGRKAIAVEKSLGGRLESTILVSGERVPAMSAARVNGYLGDIMEFNDLLSGHAGIGTVPAAMAVAEWQKAPGGAFITAVVLGYEVTSRIYNTFYQSKKDYTECCSTPVGGPNTFAAAGVAAKLMGLNASGIEEAMLIAGSLLGVCPSESLQKGGFVKPYMFGGWPASVGIYSAICAREGMTGTRTILDGDMGLLRTWAKKFDIRPLSESLGKNWALEKPRRKAHACCGYTHSPIDGMLDIVQKHHLKPTDITKVEVRVSPYVIPMVGGTVPGSALVSKFSLRYVLAVAAMSGRGIQPEDTEEPQFGRFMGEGASDLMERITVCPDESSPHYAHSTIFVRTGEGKEYLKRVEHPKGDPENPMTEAEVQDKFHLQASKVFLSERIERIRTTVYNIHNSSDILELVPLMTE